MKKFLHLYILFFVTISVAQINDPYFLVKKGDSLMITLNEVAVFPKHKFKEKSDIHYYYWFRRKVYKAYPFAVLASQKIDSVALELSKIKSRRKKRKYIRKTQKYLQEELTNPLKKLTRTEGRILLKLIHRQSGKTAFANIKELRSGWKAFWYNTTANLFKLSLKSEYLPEKENEDFLIEDILQRAFIDDKLEYQRPKLDKDYKNIVLKSRGVIDLSVYKQLFVKIRKRRARKEVQNIK
ncbi:DUF4294 domain-containing protein [Tenacibaculum piscium]|uniref:DUF4294 domain-containing protein n=2 Tax=Tenacibaculum piscium TaxID=1458515 RepID=A0A2H1YET3_9FLAO|nr:DUF4294 domain-containing protein [Tenacibaculum piscium]MBE7628813.1 DUF4294 domain-containing protein [Tenacibaculum piscium]MBE7671116.1 DUF4294 domain-containing protein [Tenacibaculum piscium]MBE7685165.1 DUF4294 domain-containing protein [Tenacibaculum piscium]MBE7689868.1 DUF4294 domain-containing protein [Tenacibaculum piscium]MCG8183731.1 DUF4294 domain-containing protein [Tenacibaculum piscium]